MILKSLTMIDFRQFYGEQRIDFAGPGPRNVTIIYGANGAGKTTLLNAFTWALFDKVTPAFENRDRLLNERVREQLQPGQSATCAVKVCFEHDDRTYYVERTQQARRAVDGRYDEVAQPRSIGIQDPNGGLEPRPTDAADVISEILPTQLHQFFFFDGERIEKLVNPRESQQDLDGAIKTILGLEVLERALEHIPGAKKLLRDSMKSYDDKALNEAVLELNRLDNEILPIESKLEVENANLAGLISQKAGVEQLLRDHVEAKQRQLLVDQLLIQEQNILSRLRTIQKETKAALSERGYMAFMLTLSQRAVAEVDAIREKGRLPAAFEAQFISDLIEKAECFCGTPLTPGSKALQNVAGVLPYAGRRDLQEAWTRIGADAARFIQERALLRDRLITIMQSAAAEESSLASTREKIQQQHALQKASGVAEVIDYEQRREDLEERQKEKELVVDRLQVRLAALITERSEADHKVTHTKTGNEKTKVIQRQLDSADRILAAVAEILTIRKERTREQLDEKIKATYAQIAFKAYTPELTTDFRLRLIKKVGAVEDVLVNKGQGENQLLALSFVGALALLAQERYNERGASGKDSLSTFEGGIYPIVMDSPFGALDENYRRELARAVPRLSPQVVTMVSKSQGLGVVQTELAATIGKTWVVAFETPKSDARAETLIVNGRPEPYISISADGFESARLVEVK